MKGAENVDLFAHTHCGRMTGEALRRKLSPMGKSSAEWADLIGVSDKTIYRLFKAHDVRTSTLERLCGALDKPITLLFDTDNSDDGKEGKEGKGAINASLIRIKREEEESAPPRKACPIEWTFNLDKKVNELLAAQHRKMSELAHHMGVTYSTVARMYAKLGHQLKIVLRGLPR